MAFLTSRLRPALQMPVDVIDRNIRYLYLEIVFASVLGAIMTFNSAYAIRLGATPFLNAILYSAPALLSAIGSIPAARFLSSRINRRLWLLGSLFLLRAGYLIIALIPLLIPYNTATWLVIWVVILNLPTIFFQNGFQVLLAELVPEERRAFVVSRRQILWSIGLVLVSLGGAAWLDHLKPPVNYQILYGFGFVTVLGSQYFMHRLIFPETVPTTAASPLAAVEQTITLRAPIRRFLFNSLLYQLGLSIPQSLFNVYYINVLKTTDGWLSLNFAMASAGVVVGYLVWERVLRKYSFGWVQRRATLLTWLFPVTLAFAQNLPVIMGANFLVNVMHGGVELANFNVLLKISRPHERPAYVSWYNAAIQFSAFLGPLIGAWLSDYVGITAVLLLSGSLRVVGGLAFSLNRVDVD